MDGFWMCVYVWCGTAPPLKTRVLLLSTGRWNTSESNETHCMILHFVRSYQQRVAGDQCSLLGDTRNNDGNVIGGSTALECSQSAWQPWHRQVLRETNQLRGWVNTLTLHLSVSCTHTHTRARASSLLAQNKCQLCHLILHRHTYRRDRAPKQVK